MDLKLRGRIGNLQKRAGHVSKWAAYRAGMTSFLPNPDRMYLESTNVCNLKCIMCPTGQGHMSRAKGYMDFDLFRRIVDEMAPRVQVTTLHIWGEPLLHPRIFEMIDYCGRSGLRCEISTNATLLTEDRQRLMLDARPSAIYLCMDGVRKETYESVRCRGDFEQTKENIEQFIALKNARGQASPFVNLQIVEMRPTEREVEEFKRQWSITGVDNINVKAFDSWGNQIDSISGLRAGSSAVPTKRYPCPNLWYHVHIYWDGSLVCCDRDFNASNPLGNVADGVMKAWRGSRMADLRRKHRRNDLEDVESCSRCVEWAWWRPTPLRSHGNSPSRK